MAALLPPRQQRIELDGPCRAKRRQHMAVRQRPLDLHALTGRRQAVTAQGRAQQLNTLGGPVGEVLQGSVLDLAVLTVALPQQDGGAGVSVGDGCNVHV